MSSRISSHLHIFSPQQHHFSSADPRTRQLPMALEIPEYVCPLNVCGNKLTLQSMDKTEPCISLTSEEGGTYLFDGIITDQTVYKVMNNDYLYEDLVSPNPIDKLNNIARDIVAGADIGVSQLVVSAGPVGSGHGTIAFSCSNSPTNYDKSNALGHLSEPRRVDYSTYNYPTTSQLTASCVDDASKCSSLQQHQYIHVGDATKEAGVAESNSSFAPQGLLWQILEHTAPIRKKDNMEWPKIACFTLHTGQQVMDLLDYPGVTEAYGMGDHLDIQPVESIDCPKKSIEYQLYTEKLSDRAQAFEGTAFGNIRDAAAAFLASGIVQPAAKDLRLPFRKAMAMSQHSNPTRLDTTSDFATFVSGSDRQERRPGTSGTLHLQSLYPDDNYDQSSRSKSHMSELLLEAKTYLKSTGQSTTRRANPISNKAFINALSNPSLITLKTHNGLITPEHVRKSGLKILNLNPSTLSLLKRSLTDRRRPVCTWEELKTVSDGTMQRRGVDSDLPCLMNIRKQKGLPNYLLSMDSCAPTVVAIYFGPSRAHSCVMFIDMCTCTTQTPLQNFSLKPQFKTSLESLVALKTLIDNLSVEKRIMQQAKLYILARLILGHVPNLSIPSKHIKQSAQYMRSVSMPICAQGIYGDTQSVSNHYKYKGASTTVEPIDASDLNPKIVTTKIAVDNDEFLDILNDENIHGGGLQQLSDSVSTTLQTINNSLHDITLIHSVQICETDVKNTLQQLRLASSLDRKVEMGFYWSTQLYNDAMTLARMGVLQKNEDYGFSSMPLSHTSIHDNPYSTTIQGEGILQPTLTDVLTNSTISISSETKNDKNQHLVEAEAINYCDPQIHLENEMTIVEANHFVDGCHCEYSTSPEQNSMEENSLSTLVYTQLPDNKGEEQNRRLYTHSPALQHSINNPISSLSKKIANADIDSDADTTILLARLHKYIDRAEAMMDDLDTRINTSFTDLKI